MVNTSLTRVLGRLIIEVKTSVTNLNEYVSCTSKFCIEDDLASEEFFIELNALLNIRRKNMDMMDVTNQFGLLLYFAKLSYYRNNIWINRFDIWLSFS